MKVFPTTVLSVVAVVAGACIPTSPPGTSVSADWTKLPAVVAPDRELAPIGTRDAQYARLCAKQHGDSFFKLICGAGSRPNITDLTSLLKLVGLGDTRAFALTANSTSLVAMSVSALNPRILVFPRVSETLERPKDLIVLGFVRGEQFVEVVSRDAGTGEPNFYMLSFEQECSYRADGGCDLANLLTEEIEHNWTAYSVYDQKDLENTSFDCQTCHQPGGFGTKTILRMQELNSPWLHWFPQRFVQRTESDRVLTTQFSQIHDVDKQYGGIPIATIVNALDEGSGAQLEALLRAEGYAEQPNPFDAQIAAEAAGGGQSATWLTRFQAALRGEAITVPYPLVDVTDQAKRVEAVKSYRDVASGSAARETLVDIRETFSQDAMEKLSFVPQPGADGRAVLVQMCSRCHDGRANPALTRSRFNVQKLDQMPREAKERAIVRMQEPRETRMPPWRVGVIAPAGLDAAIAELRK